MKKDLMLFFEKLFSEPEFRQSFAKTKSAKEGYEKAKPYIEGVTFQEFKEGLTYVHDKLLSKKFKGLNDEELTRVSGGSKDKFMQVLDLLTTYNALSINDIK